MKLHYIFSGILIASVFQTHAQDGVLDATFADNAGYVLVNHSEVASELLSHIAVMPNGKIVLAGNIGDALNNQFIVVRLLEDGTRDATFGTDGVAVINLSPGTTETLSGMVLQGDRIILSGTVTNFGTGDFFAMRLQANGSVDETFGSLGATIIDIGPGTEEVARVLREDANGKLLIGGSSEDPDGPNGPDFAVARLTADGQLDVTFSNDGIFTWAIVNQEDVVRDFVFNAADQIFLVGEAVSAGQRKLVIGALNNDGSKDFSYGPNSTARVTHALDAESNVFVNRAVLEAGGGIMAFGSIQQTIHVAAMAQFDAAGAFTDFQGSGFATLGFQSEIRDAVRVEDGYVMAGSAVSDDNITLNSLVLRVNDDADLVTTFGTDGMLNEDVTGLGNDLVFGIAMQGTDHAIVVGSGDAGGLNGIYGFAYRVSVAQEEQTGIADHALQQFSVFPNPTADILRIPADAQGVVSVYDVRGAVIMTRTVAANSSLDVSTLPNGLYTLVIGQERAARFVKN